VDEQFEKHLIPTALKIILEGYTLFSAIDNNPFAPGFSYAFLFDLIFFTNQLNKPKRERSLYNSGSTVKLYCCGVVMVIH
jgi:hypothetical protein